MKKLPIIMLCIGTSSLWAAGETAMAPKQAELSEAQQYENYLSEQGMEKPVVTDNLNDFVTELVQRTNGNSFTVYEYVGFSGAGYENEDQFKKDFERAVLQARKDSRKFGSSTKTIFLLGGTTAGIGMGYDIIENLVAQKKVSRQEIIVGGLVSDSAVKYQMKNKRTGEGDVISPNQDVVLLMDVYKGPGKVEAWELRATEFGPSATVEVLTKLFAQPKARLISLELFEGGDIAAKEAREFVSYWKDRMTIGIKTMPRLVLRPGYLPKRPEKITGLPAATELATHPEVGVLPFVFLQPIGSQDMAHMPEATRQAEQAAEKKENFRKKMKAATAD